MAPSEYRKKLAKETEEARGKGIGISTGDLEKTIKYACVGAKIGSTADKLKSEKGVYDRKEDGR